MKKVKTKMLRVDLTDEERADLQSISERRGGRVSLATVVRQLIFEERKRLVPLADEGLGPGNVPCGSDTKVLSIPGPVVLRPQATRAEVESEIARARADIERGEKQLAAREDPANPATWREQGES